ncbi:MAG: hypothetical protein K8S97_08635, partial [Anaerolineae bacterium]|nr:hypothetical protein [Anaerolineae bacterium]
HVDRVRLSDRYVLLDMPDDDGGTLRLGALLLAEGDGGLGHQATWLSHSPIVGLLADEGFEVREM